MIDAMNLLALVFKLARPRFFSYLAGPLLVGFIAGSESKLALLNLDFLLLLFFFLIPANVILYGVNDLSDEDTDQYNPKKRNQEILLAAQIKKAVQISVATCLVFFIFILIVQPVVITKLLLLVWLFLSSAYSLKPIRFKSRPWLDMISNVLYIIPGLIGYSLATSLLPSIWFILAASFWAMAMHLFSAVPDITADTKAHLTTTAVVLGFNRSLILCAVLWTLSGISLGIASSWHPVTLLALIYPVLALIPWQKPHFAQQVYWWFPQVNTMVGFCFFLLTFLPLPYAA